jgi:ferric-dicitrate binding protein FerR (iron transport regulator)
MSEHEPAQTDLLHEELSAYLDGELDADAVGRIEERLARDPAYQAELQRLERAWGLLDRLPRASVDEAFTKSTIEMVAVAAALVVATGVGYVIGTQIWKDPNQPLLEDLKVVENLDSYYQVDDIEFLRMLESEGLFADGDQDRAN